MHKRDLQGHPNKLMNIHVDFIGRRVESIHDGHLLFYNQPSWTDIYVVGHLNKGEGFPTIVNKLKVGNG
ncbi:hypothetical protein [Virgibacillus sp.]|uniref:hypothetical protein n=1 Tax=Virgibacillus sp. TaxID=1872700 RepID=UPI00345C5F70